MFWGVAILIGKHIAMWLWRVLHSCICPADYSADFVSHVFNEFAEHDSGNSFEGGDFNCCLNSLDMYLSKSSNLPKQAKFLSSTVCLNIGYEHVWRTRHPYQLGLTFFSAPHTCHSSIDYFFIPICKNAFHLFLWDWKNPQTILLSTKSRSRIFKLLLLYDEQLTLYLKAKFKIFNSINSSASVRRGLCISFDGTEKNALRG